MELHNLDEDFALEKKILTVRSKNKSMFFVHFLNIAYFFY